MAKKLALFKRTDKENLNSPIIISQIQYILNLYLKPTIICVVRLIWLQIKNFKSVIFFYTGLFSSWFGLDLN